VLGYSYSLLAIFLLAIFLPHVLPVEWALAFIVGGVVATGVMLIVHSRFIVRRKASDDDASVEPDE